MKTIIHVNQHKIRANAKRGSNNPVLSVKTYKSNDYAHEVEIDGPCVVRYSPDKPLSCGAHVWIETQSKVNFTNKTSMPQLTREQMMKELLPGLNAIWEKTMREDRERENREREERGGGKAKVK